MYANVKDRKIASVFNVVGAGVVDGSLVDLRLENRIVDEFALMVKGYTYTLLSPTVKNGGFETAGGGGADVFANWTEQMNGGTVISQTAVAGEFHGGTKACKIVVEANPAFQGSVSQAILTVGRSYTVTFWARGAVGGEILQVFCGATQMGEHMLAVGYGQYTTTFVADNTTLFIITKNDPANAGATMFVDDVTVTAAVAEDLAPTAFTGALEASLDGGAHWTSLQAITQANDGAILIVANKPVDYFRLNVTLFTKANAASDYVTFSLLGA